LSREGYDDVEAKNLFLMSMSRRHAIGQGSNGYATVTVLGRRVSPMRMPQSSVF
jgi:hypothetical protein